MNEKTNEELQDEVNGIFDQIEQSSDSENTAIEDDINTDDDIFELTDDLALEVENDENNTEINQDKAENIQDNADDIQQQNLPSEDDYTEDEEPAPEEENMEDILSSIRDAISDGEDEEKTEDAQQEQQPTNQENSTEPNIASDISIDNLKESFSEAVDFCENYGSDNKNRLISKEAESEASGSINNLVEVASPKVNNIGFEGQQTMEDLTRELVKPMLKEWLDQNLPIIVKELVEKEIRRITNK